MYLRATVTYSDKFGAGKTASAVSANRVEGARPCSMPLPPSPTRMTMSPLPTSTALGPVLREHGRGACP